MFVPIGRRIYTGQEKPFITAYSSKKLEVFKINFWIFDHFDYNKLTQQFLEGGATAKILLCFQFGVLK